MTEVVIVSGIRTAIGNYGGALRDTPAAKLGSIVIKEALKGGGLRPKRDPEVLSYAPEMFKNAGLIELEKRYHNWDDSLKEVRYLMSSKQALSLRSNT